MQGFLRHDSRVDTGGFWVVRKPVCSNQPAARTIEIRIVIDPPPIQFT